MRETDNRKGEKCKMEKRRERKVEKERRLGEKKSSPDINQWSVKWVRENGVLQFNNEPQP